MVVVVAGGMCCTSSLTHAQAPSVHLVGSTYYLYYSVSTFGTQNSVIGYATSSDLVSWTDHGSVGISSAPGSTPYNAIDACLAVSGSTYRMVYGSFWNDLYECDMSSPGAAVRGSSFQVAYNATGSHSIEGAYLFHYGSYWYLFFSAGQCCGYDANRPARGEEYKIYACRSTSMAGPFADASGRSCTSSGGTLVLASHGNVYGPGGQGVYQDPSSGTVYLYYHYVYIPNGYSDGAKLLGVNRLDFSNGWPRVV